MNYRKTGKLLLIAGILCFIVELVTEQPSTDIYYFIGFLLPLTIAFTGFWLIWKYGNQQNLK